MLTDLVFINNCISEEDIVFGYLFIYFTQSFYSQQIKQIIGNNNFDLVHVDASVEYCRSHAENGLYKEAEEGKLKNLPGVDIAYEKPQKPRFRFQPEKSEASAQQVLDYLQSSRIFPLS